MKYDFIKILANKLSIQKIFGEFCYATSLSIGYRHINSYVDDKVKEMFAKELERDIDKKIESLGSGEKIEYFAHLGNISPMSIASQNINQNLQDVLNKLPALDGGKMYDFPFGTYIIITLNKNGLNYTICPWIEEALRKIG